MQSEHLPEPQDPRSTFGNRLAAARKLAGLTQEQLGAGLAPNGGDVTNAAVSAWEVGRTQPTAIQLGLIVDRLNACGVVVTADHLLGRDVDPARTKA